MNELDILIFLGLRKVGRKTVKKIIDSNTINTPIEKPGDYLNILGTISPKIANSLSIDDVEDSKFKAKQIIEGSLENGIEVIGYDNKAYPKLLKGLDMDAPVILFVKGDVGVLAEEKKVAVIGTRNNSEYGYKAGRNITKNLVEKGYVIVSGLAKGCDTIAHKACLDSGGRTIAVMAGGLDSIYPRENKVLAEQIIKNGCLISEYPIGTKSLANYFVERDRIQSGLSSGVIVIETGITGGTHHTVKFGKKQGRSVACIKYKEGFELSSNEGNRMLISNGTADALDSSNIDDYIKTLEVVYSRITGILDANNKSDIESLNNESSYVESSLNQELIKSSHAPLIAGINKKIEELKQGINTIEQNQNNQTSLFPSNASPSSDELSEIKVLLKELEKKINVLSEEFDQILKTKKGI